MYGVLLQKAALRLVYVRVPTSRAELAIASFVSCKMSFYPCTVYGKSLDFALLPEVIANSCSSPIKNGSYTGLYFGCQCFHCVEEISMCNLYHKFINHHMHGWMCTLVSNVGG